MTFAARLGQRTGSADSTRCRGDQRSPLPCPPPSPSSVSLFEAGAGPAKTRGGRLHEADSGVNVRRPSWPACRVPAWRRWARPPALSLPPLTAPSPPLRSYIGAFVLPNRRARPALTRSGPVKSPQRTGKRWPVNARPEAPARQAGSCTPPRLRAFPQIATAARQALAPMGNPYLANYGNPRALAPMGNPNPDQLSDGSNTRTCLAVISHSIAR